MHNYVHRIPLGEDKWAYEQKPSLIEPANIWMDEIRKRWQPPNYFFHLRSGGHVAAARSHLKNRYFAKTDLRRFFEQVTKNRIIRRLSGLGFQPDDAIDFAVASTIRISTDGQDRFALPYGFVQSPLLASLDIDKSELGRTFSNLDKSGHTISVYVDDIVISGPTKEQVEEGLTLIRDAASVSNYEINEAKSTNTLPSMVAFNIAFGHEYMHVTDDRITEFEQAILTTYDEDAKIAVLAYIKSINHAQAVELFNKFESHLECARHIVTGMR
jgi:hypothetical protein